MFQIDKIQTARESAGQRVDDHFVDVNKMIRRGSGSEREVNDMMQIR
jgi:DNA-damage-inducible protein D